MASTISLRAFELLGAKPPPPVETQALRANEASRTTRMDERIMPLAVSKTLPPRKWDRRENWKGRGGFGINGAVHSPVHAESCRHCPCLRPRPRALRGMAC